MFEYNRGKPVSTALSAKLTNLLAQWIATSCRPISVVEDDGLKVVLQAARRPGSCLENRRPQAATGDPSYKLPILQTNYHEKNT